MITVGTARFAKNDKELIESLFYRGGTANGTYKHSKKGITHFYNGAGVLFAALIDNKHGKQFFVSAGIRKGKKFYMYGLSTPDKQALGLDGFNYTQEMNEATRVAETVKGN